MTCISDTSQRVHQSAVLDNKKVSLTQEKRNEGPSTNKSTSDRGEGGMDRQENKKAEHRQEDSA